MLDEGLHAGLGFLGIRSRTILYAEREAYPVAVLEARVEKKLAAGAPLTVEEIDSALSLLKRCEDALIRHTREEIESAVRTEQICIELDALEIRRAA